MVRKKQVVAFEFLACISKFYDRDKNKFETTFGNVSEEEVRTNYFVNNII